MLQDPSPPLSPSKRNAKPTSDPFPSTTTPPTPTRPSSSTPFHPPADTSTYRDLLLFEERLKMNAEMLRRRRRRYRAFLWSFLGALAYLAHRLVFLPPTNLLTMRALQATAAVVFITLALFFASGMYEEKIRYAHSYINHSNKTLRPLNMHLNLRRPGFGILSFLHRPLKPPLTVPTPPSTKFPPGPARRGPLQPTVMAQIPASSNPRGELIFSSRVDKSFREGYERYRAAFERRREEKARQDAGRRAGFMRWRKRDGVRVMMNPTPTPTPPASRRGTPPPPPPPGLGSRGRTPSPGSRLRFGGEDEKREKDSYSFAWTGTGDTGSLRRAS